MSNERRKAEESLGTDDFEDIIVREGFYSDAVDETRPVKFRGKLLVTATNKTGMIGPNHYKWHEWGLYAALVEKMEGLKMVRIRGFVIVDKYLNTIGKNNRTTIHDQHYWDHKTIAGSYPALANAAVKAGIWTEKDITDDRTPKA